MISRLLLASFLAVSALSFAGAEAADVARRVFVQQDEAATEPQSPEIQNPGSGMTNGCVLPEDLGYKSKRLSELSLNIHLDAATMPDDCSKDVFQLGGVTTERSWHDSEFTWAASDLFAQPAYFDDPILERYGQSHHPVLQPALSGAHFFSQFPLMPYKIGLDRTHDQIYTLGYYRPGSPMPLLGRRLPLEADAAGFESMSWVALLFILP